MAPPRAEQPQLEWRGVFESRELEALHAEGFKHPPGDADWWAQVNRHSLGWVCLRDADRLVGFVNLVWDGRAHAFLLDTVVEAAFQRRGLATLLVAEAVERARAAGCEWLHVDFEAHLTPFYLDACGFSPTDAGLIHL